MSAFVPINYSVPASTMATYADLEKRVNAFGSQHTGGANFALADGSVRYVQNAIDAVNLRRLCMRNDAEILSLD